MRGPSPRARTSGSSSGWWGGRTAAYGLTALAAALIYGWDLGGWDLGGWDLGDAVGGRGLSGSEGHRVAPAWAMLTGESGWIIPEMFGQAYLRKPPGLVWAIAGGSWVLGPTALAARVVSALSAAGLAMWVVWISRRWFGGVAGLWAGLAAVLMPWMWAFGRAAEIEALNQLGTAAAILSAVDLMAWRRGRAWPAMLAAGLGVGVMLLSKGPAGLIAVGGGVLGAGLAMGGGRGAWARVFTARWWAPAGVGAAAFGAWAIAAAARAPADAVTQGVSDFQFGGSIIGTLSLPAVAWASTLPAGLALLFPWGPDARAEGRASAHAAARLRMARALGIGFAVAAVASAAVGLSNPRYALPAAVMVPPVVGWAGASLPFMMPTRRAIARAMMLGHPAAVVGALVVGWMGYLRGVEGPWRASSGWGAGEALAGALSGSVGPSTDAVTVWADGAVEARPEVLLAMRARWAELRPGAAGLDVRWRPGLIGATLAPGAYALLRADALGDEASAVGWPSVTVAEVVVHRYTMRLVRRVGVGVDAGPDQSSSR